MILITGATGFIGSKLVKKLLTAGYKVRALVLANDPLIKNLEGLNCEIFTGDILDKNSLTEPLKNVSIVYHLAGIMVSADKDAFYKLNFLGTKNLLEKCIETKIKHFIFLSAAAANYKIPTTYGQVKYLTEKLIIENHKIDYTIIRPTLVYGPNGGQEFMLYLKNLKNSSMFFPLINFGKARKQFVYIEDLLTGLSFLPDNNKSFGKIYNFSGGSDLSMLEITKILLKYFNIKKILVPLPLAIAKMLVFFIKILNLPINLNSDFLLGVAMDANFSYQEANQDLGYRPKTLLEGLNLSFPTKKI